MATVCNLAKETGVSSFSRLIDVTTWLNFQDGFDSEVISWIDSGLFTYVSKYPTYFSIFDHELIVGVP